MIINHITPEREIHASAVLYCNNAILFIGQNNSGKSTTAERLCETDSFSFIEDDICSVRIDDGTATLFHQGELRRIIAVFHIVKNSELKIRQLAPIEKKLRVSRSFFEVYRNAKSELANRKNIFDFSVDFADCFPVYSLHLMRESIFIPLIIDKLNELIPSRDNALVQ